jgi:4-amino-4-deoxy-L-arabinose transferase-like glycosyltransferase
MDNAELAQEQRTVASKCFAQLLVLVIFLIGLSFRLMIFQQTHEEGDEVIYQSLVEQLEAGRGYTLQGSPIIESGRFETTQYSGVLFYHPPGGVGLFWLLHRMLGTQGIPMAQLVSYTVFFFSMMWLAHLVTRPPTGLAWGLLALLTAFTPIAVHVMNHYWLDGPLLAFTTMSAALFIFGVTRNRPWWIFAGGTTLGYAALVKLTALSAVPGFLLLVWTLKPQARFSKIIRLGFCLLLPAFLLHLPWEIWEWKKTGMFFPPMPGKPSDALVASNLFVSYVTVSRSPWTYLTILPRVLWTLPVSVLAWARCWRNPELLGKGMALIGWIVVILVLQIVLGYLGYSKLMRYAILVTPATVLLFGLAVSECRGLWLWMLIIGLSLEVAQGIQTNVDKKDLIIPLFGGW